jgi:hypothetical protein
MVALFLFLFVGCPIIYICVVAFKVESGMDKPKQKRVKQASEPASAPPRIREERAGFVTSKLERIERGVK